MGGITGGNCRQVPGVLTGKSSELLEELEVLSSVCGATDAKLSHTENDN